MAKFDVTPEMLPKIVAVRTRGDDGRLLTLLYDGASNIEAICSFLGGLADNNNDEHSGTEHVVRACEEEVEMKNERKLPVIFLCQAYTVGNEPFTISVCVSVCLSDDSKTQLKDLSYSAACNKCLKKQDI